ncbi:hypothetical protein [Aureimonas sp. AU40]|uniref:hypothetical protein n=1 Tax=Aureimonas sp. AU40 TaxID=1637747 RepID=UPI00078306FF|nr:hypothetical protein [Aureimonas sp. AU40]
MPPRSFRALRLTGALAMAVGVSSPASAFSQITDQDGASANRQGGIVSVPLPPVPDAAQPSPPAGESAPAAAPPAGVPGATAPAASAPPAANAAPVVEPATQAPPALPAPQPAAPATPPAGGDPDSGISQPRAADVPPAEIFYGDEKLPAPVRDLRRKLIEVAKTGEIEKLKPLLETGPEGTAVSTSDDGQDPIEILKNASGDGKGVELLAILLETLQAGYVHLDPGGENELYMWPYFTQVNLEKLTKPQLVELFELVTAGDYERMVGNGSYDFYRVGLSPEGRFEFFIAGD